MKTSLFDFTLPESLIADIPVSPRDAARLLVIPSPACGGGLGRGQFKDRIVCELPEFLRQGDVMVFNDTRVIPARLLGKRGDAKIEVLLHKRKPSPLVGEGDAKRRAKGLEDHTQSPHPNLPPQGGKEYWVCFAKPAKKLKAGDVILFAPDFSADVVSKNPDGQVVIAFPEQLSDLLKRYGHMPLPPYIEKKREAVIARSDSDLPTPKRSRIGFAQAGEAIQLKEKVGSPRPLGPRDDESYQTIYARHDGSVAAPTAGLHFTPDLLAAIDKAGATRVHVTLHVGGGTFLPVKVDDTTDHVMHSEWAEISQQTADAINTAKQKGGRIIAVGTTSLRTLESAVDEEGIMRAFSGETNIFITPGYRFKTADLLLTNFHLPRSTLFMLVCAFAGLEYMKAAYAHAIAHHYRFYSYGDACLLYLSKASSIGYNEE